MKCSTCLLAALGALPTYADATRTRIPAGAVLALSDEFGSVNQLPSAARSLIFEKGFAKPTEDTPEPETPSATLTSALSRKVLRRQAIGLPTSIVPSTTLQTLALRAPTETQTDTPSPSSSSSTTSSTSTNSPTTNPSDVPPSISHTTLTAGALTGIIIAAVLLLLLTLALAFYLYYRRPRPTWRKLSKTPTPTPSPSTATEDSEIVLGSEHVPEKYMYAQHALDADLPGVRKGEAAEIPSGWFPREDLPYPPRYGVQGIPYPSRLGTGFGEEK